MPNKHEMKNVNHVQQTMDDSCQPGQIRCIIDRQELKDTHNDTINYHEVTRDSIPKYIVTIFNIKLF